VQVVLGGAAERAQSRNRSRAGIRCYHSQRRWALRAGQIATPVGILPTLMGADTAPVAVVITDTVVSP